MDMLDLRSRVRMLLISICCSSCIILTRSALAVYRLCLMPIAYYCFIGLDSSAKGTERRTDIYMITIPIS
jgi:hypothetical protein